MAERKATQAQIRVVGGDVVVSWPTPLARSYEQPWKEKEIWRDKINQVLEASRSKPRKEIVDREYFDPKFSVVNGKFRFYTSKSMNDYYGHSSPEFAGERRMDSEVQQILRRTNIKF